MSANELFNIHKFPVNITWVNNTNKNKFKTEQIQTFPQIYLTKFNNKGNLLLGGYTELSDCINTFLKKKLNNNDIDNFINKTNWSKKSTLRLIQLINNINSK